MKDPRISIIAAIAKDSRIIGNEAQIPWHIPEDFRYFKEKTMGHPIIMGRKTFETFPKPLPGRIHIVLTRDENYAQENNLPDEILISNNIEDAISKAHEVELANDTNNKEIFIIGGGQIYEQSLKHADKLYLTLVDTDAIGNITFPEYENIFTKVISKTDSSDDKYKYSFVVLEK